MQVMTIPGNKLATRILVNPAIFNPIATIIMPPVAVISLIIMFNASLGMYELIVSAKIDISP